MITTRLVATCLLVLWATGCAKPYKVRTTTSEPNVALPEFALGGPAAQLTPVANPGDRPAQLQAPDHRRMHAEGLLWVGYVKSRLDAWNVSGRLRKLGVTHWYADVFTQTTTRTHTYCKNLEYNDMGFQQCGMFSGTATQVEKKTRAFGLVGQMFMPRSSIPKERHAAIEAAWANYLVLEAAAGKPVLDLAFELGANANARVEGEHWLDHVCKSETVHELASWNVAALLQRGADLTPARTTCLLEKFHRDPLLVSVLMSKGDNGRTATKAAVDAHDCLTAAVLLEMGAGGQGCSSSSASAEVRSRLLGHLGAYLMEAPQPMLPVVQAFAKHMRLTPDDGPSPPLVLLALARWQHSLRGGAGVAPESYPDLLRALISAGADANHLGTLAVMVPGTWSVTVSPLEAAMLSKNEEAEAILRQAGGTVDPARLQAAQAAAGH